MALSNGKERGLEYERSRIRARLVTLKKGKYKYVCGVL